MKKTLFVIDGHALCYRAYYAFIKSQLKNPENQDVSAIFGFARMLYRLIEEQDPDYLAVAFDPPVKSFRFDLYSEYKANRQKMPGELRSQIEEIKRMVDILGITRIEDNNYEADDVLGTMAKKFASEECDVVLVTGDKDAYQLVDEHVRIYANKKGISEYEIYDTEGVENKLGITPDRVIDYMALMGDSSDNIPGVKGIGEKTALKLILSYGSLEGIYENVEKISGRQKELLIEEKEMAFISRDLVTIRTDVPLDFDLDQLRKPDITSEEARAFFTHHDMGSVLRDHFPPEAGALSGNEPKEKKYTTVLSEDVLEDMIALIRSMGEVSMDTETTSVSPVDADLIGMSFSIEESSGWYIPMVSGGLFSEAVIERERAMNMLRPILEDPGIRKIGQNIKYDIIVLRGAGVEVAGVYFDTMVASYLLDPTLRRHNLDDMALRYLDYTTITYKDLTGTGKKAIPITDVPLERLSEYAIEDADITWRLYLIFRDRLKEQDLDKLFHDIEMPLVEVLADMEYTGVTIDPGYFELLGQENRKMLSSVEKKIYAEAGQAFNINSTRELAAILFDSLGLKPQKKTKTGYSTDITVLEALKGSHPIIDHLISYRTLSKLMNTYIDSLPRLVSARTGRIHTSYNQTVVATGRLSSSDPNLQNIPARDEFGKKVRRGFVAQKGFILMSADYSQIELRLAAHLSDDANMAGAFRDGTDIHALTASSVFGVSLDSVTQEMRRQAKIINFATIYGVSPFGLSQQADINVKDAAAFIDRYFETYPGFRDYIDRTVDFARKNGHVRTLLGRIRAVPEINSETSFRREGAERVAINTPIQGTCADMIKIAMINIYRDFKDRGLKSEMIMQVHDELVFQVALDEKEVVEKLVRERMEQALELSVPAIVDIGWGQNWEEAH